MTWTPPPPVAAAPVVETARRDDQVRTALFTFGVLLVVGVIMGFVWAAWSPARPPGVELPAGTIQINESEAFAAADGRFALITALVGLIAGITVWFFRSSRGPWVAGALVLGGLAGAWVMEIIGHLAGGGTNSGPPQAEIPHLPLSLHLTGLYMLEGLLAVLVYSILVAFAVDDDLGRPDPARDAARRRPGPDQQPAVPQQSVQPEYLLQHGGADGNGPGLPQQDQFPTQDPGQGPQTFPG